jgi:1,6-anhydro-N-acetylmuramate kinase
MRQILAMSAMVVMAGCASQAPAPLQVASATPAAAAGSAVAVHQVCHKETVFGTNFTQTVCHGASVDPSDPNLNNVTDDAVRQLGNNQAFIGRAGKG